MKIKKLLKKCDKNFYRYVITDKDSGHGPTIYDRSEDVIADYGSWDVFGWGIEIRIIGHFDDFAPILHITV